MNVHSYFRKLGHTGMLAFYRAIEAFLHAMVNRDYEIVWISANVIPTGPKADDYTIRYDLSEVVRILRSGRLVALSFGRINAGRDDMNRTLLAERLEQEFLRQFAEQKALYELPRKRARSRKTDSDRFASDVGTPASQLAATFLVDNPLFDRLMLQMLHVNIEPVLEALLKYGEACLECRDERLAAINLQNVEAALDNAQQLVRNKFMKETQFIHFQLRDLARLIADINQAPLPPVRGCYCPEFIPIDETLTSYETASAMPSEYRGLLSVL